MKSSILNLLLLILKIFLDFSSNTSYKSGEFSKTLPEKDFEFVWSGREGTIIFNMSFLLLLAEVDSIPEKQNYNKNTLGACSTSYVKIVFILSIKVVVLNMGATMVQVGVLDYRSLISRCVVCLAIFFALYQQFKGQLDSFLQVYISIHI